jgi:hypothetical protein
MSDCFKICNTGVMYGMMTHMPSESHRRTCHTQSVFALWRGRAASPPFASASLGMTTSQQETHSLHPLIYIYSRAQKLPHLGLKSTWSASAQDSRGSIDRPPSSLAVPVDEPSIPRDKWSRLTDHRATYMLYIRRDRRHDTSGPGPAREFPVGMHYRWLIYLESSII